MATIAPAGDRRRPGVKGSMPRPSSLALLADHRSTAECGWNAPKSLRHGQPRCSWLFSTVSATVSAYSAMLRWSSASLPPASSIEYCMRCRICQRDDGWKISSPVPVAVFGVLPHWSDHLGLRGPGERVENSDSAISAAIQYRPPLVRHSCSEQCGLSVVIMPCSPVCVPFIAIQRCGNRHRVSAICVYLVTAPANNPFCHPSVSASMLLVQMGRLRRT